MSAITRFFHPVLPSRALRKKPVKVTIDGESYALFRDARGRANAVADRCPHRFAPLSKGHVRGNLLVCPYHGWTFDGEGRGRSASQPSLTRCDVRAMRAEERHGYIWIASRDATGSVPRWDFEADHRFCGSFPMRFDAPLHVALDNFSEDEHTPFVHTRLGWDEDGLDRIGFRADNFDDRTEVHYDAPQRPTRAGRVFGLRPGDVFHNDWVTRFDPVHTIYRTRWVDPKTSTVRPLRIVSPIFFVPETDKTTILHTFVFIQLGESHARFFPLLRHIATAIAWGEIRDDSRFVPLVRDTPASMRGMRLGKFDKPLVQNRRLLEKLYFARVASPDDGADDAHAGS